MGSLVVRASDSRSEGLDGDIWCRHPSSLRRISPSSIVLLPVCCSRRTTGVPLAPCHDEFRGPRSDYFRQVALEAIKKYDSVFE
ncbi:hypothetical protein TNCV_4687751 [Trichonephila clavipes]|nr:hypothetical protein TNCV_4687751 [Trichonephila clavipes]